MKRLLFLLLAFTPAFLSAEPARRGLGFTITRQGHIVTCYHLVEGKQAVKIRQAGRTLDAQVVSFDKNRDLALLYASGTSGTFLRLSTDSLGTGERVRVFGYGLSESPDDSVSSFDGDIGSVERAGTETYFSGPESLSPLSSGAPVLNEYGTVCAMVNARPPKGCSIPPDRALTTVGYVRSLLRHEGVAPPDVQVYDAPAASIVVILGPELEEALTAQESYGSQVQLRLENTTVSEAVEDEPLAPFLDRVTNKAGVRLAMGRSYLGNYRHTGTYTDLPVKSVLSDVQTQHGLKCESSASGVLMLKTVLPTEYRDDKAWIDVEEDRIEREKGSAIAPLTREGRFMGDNVYEKLARYSRIVRPLRELWDFTCDPATFNALTLNSPESVAAERAFVKEVKSKIRKELTDARVEIGDNYDDRESSYDSYYSSYAYRRSRMGQRPKVVRWSDLLRASGVGIDLDRFEEAHASAAWNKEAALNLLATNWDKVANKGKAERIRFTDQALNQQLDGFLKNLEGSALDVEDPGSQGVFELEK